MTTEPTNPGKRTPEERLRLISAIAIFHDSPVVWGKIIELCDHITALESELTDKDRQHMMTVNGLVEQLDKMKVIEAELKDMRRYAMEKDETATTFMNQVKRLQKENAELKHRAEQAEQELRHISENPCGVKVEGDVTLDMVYTFVDGAIEKQAEYRFQAENKVANLLTKQNDDIETHQLIVNGLEFKVQELREALSQLKPDPHCPWCSPNGAPCAECLIMARLEGQFSKALSAMSEKKGEQG